MKSFNRAISANKGLFVFCYVGLIICAVCYLLAAPPGKIYWGIGLLVGTAASVLYWVRKIREFRG